MKLQTLNGKRIVSVNPARYLVNWKEKEASKFQTEVKDFLHPFWKTHYVCSEFRIPGSLLRCDLINFTNKTVVEISGKQHIEYNKHFHGKNRQKFHAQIVRDVLKMQWAERQGFTFVEIYPKDLPLTREFFKEKFGVNL